MIALRKTGAAVMVAIMAAAAWLLGDMLDSFEMLVVIGGSASAMLGLALHTWRRPQQLSPWAGTANLALAALPLLWAMVAMHRNDAPVTAWAWLPALMLTEALLLERALLGMIGRRPRRPAAIDVVLALLPLAWVFLQARDGASITLYRDRQTWSRAREIAVLLYAGFAALSLMLAIEREPTHHRGLGAVVAAALLASYGAWLGDIPGDVFLSEVVAYGAVLSWITLGVLRLEPDDPIASSPGASSSASSSEPPSSSRRSARESSSRS